MQELPTIEDSLGLPILDEVECGPDTFSLSCRTSDHRLTTYNPNRFTNVHVIPVTSPFFLLQACPWTRSAQCISSPTLLAPDCISAILRLSKPPPLVVTLDVYSPLKLLLVPSLANNPPQIRLSHSRHYKQYKSHLPLLVRAANYWRWINNPKLSPSHYESGAGEKSLNFQYGCQSTPSPSSSSRTCCPRT